MMLDLGDIVVIKETGKEGEIVDVSPKTPHVYAVEWEDGDSWDWGSFFEEDLIKLTEARTA